jgi:hypothetical protein
VIPAALARELARLGLVTYDEAGADCFLEDIAPDPADAVGIYTRTGLAPDPKHAYDAPRLQVLVRADGTSGRAREGFERAQAIQDAVHGVRHATWGKGTVDELRVIDCKALGSQPLNLGDDDQGRPRWSVLLQLEVLRPGPLRES